MRFLQVMILIFLLHLFRRSHERAFSSGLLLVTIVCLSETTCCFFPFFFLISRTQKHVEFISESGRGEPNFSLHSGPNSGRVVALKIGRREVPGSNPACAFRLSRSEFSLVFSETSVNRG